MLLANISPRYEVALLQISCFVFVTSPPRQSEVNGGSVLRETASSAQNAHWRTSSPMDEGSTDRQETREWEAVTSI
jgi:hypothetical protein